MWVSVTARKQAFYFLSNQLLIAYTENFISYCHNQCLEETTTHAKMSEKQVGTEQQDGLAGRGAHHQV